VPAIPVLDLQPLFEVRDDPPVDELFPAFVETGLVTQRGDQDLQALAERVVAEIRHAGLLDGDRHQVAR
jgi:hypothetical protein